MPRTAVLNRPIELVESPWRTWLRQLNQAFRLDADERFVCEARDLADLERRLRQLERGRAERFGSLPRDA